MSTELIINASLPETRIALMEDGEIQELLIERASGKGIVGNIYKGRVTRVLPGMQAAFVDIGLEKAAFLYVDDVFVHPEMWEEDEGPEPTEVLADTIQPEEPSLDEASTEEVSDEEAAGNQQSSGEEFAEPSSDDETDFGDPNDDEDDEDDEDPSTPALMGADGDDDSGAEDGTVAPSAGSEESGGSASPKSGKFRRGRRGGRSRRRVRGEEGPAKKASVRSDDGLETDEAQGMTVHGEMESASMSDWESDRSAVSLESEQGPASEQSNEEVSNRPAAQFSKDGPSLPQPIVDGAKRRPEFKETRGRDRKIKSRTTERTVRVRVNIQDLLKEGQEVLVQVAKDPISSKGARLTCHISLPGRHLVCMPTIDHVGVSRRIDRDEERRRLRDFVERNRPRNLGFIVRTASGKSQSEKRIKQDIDYLTRLWSEIREKAGQVNAPSLVYEDLNSVLRSIRDWVTEDIDKIVVDSRYHFNEIQRFVSHFMPPLRQKVDLYSADVPIFDAYNISTELSRSLERKVWLKSGGYIVIDQAEALVAIDVNTGRYVGKKNLEDTILKTNLEAVQEIAYQLRLRNCGGIIILDLIDMEKEENKQRVYRVLEEAIKKDRARPTILKISELGLVEMTRKRTRDTIIRTLCEPCTHCEAKGYIKGKQTVAYEIMREIEREGTERDISKILVQAHADVIDILAIDERETLDQLERRYRKQIYLQAVTDYHPEQFEVASEKKDRAERGRDSATHAESGAGDSRSRRGGGREKTNRWGKNTQAPGAVRTVSGPPALPRPVIRDEETAEPRVLEVQVLTPPMPRDPDAIGNAVSTQIVTPNSGLVAPRPTGDDFHDEEDRLAFLRAQAAQDAAIASLVQAPGNGNQTQNNRGRPGFGGGQGFGGRDRNGGGGGKNQAGRRRKGRGGRMGGQEPREGVRSSAPRPFGPTNIVRPAQSEAPRVEAAPSSSDSNEGGGGGGERSNPPTTT